MIAFQGSSQHKDLTGTPGLPGVTGGAGQGGFLPAPQPGLSVTTFHLVQKQEKQKLAGK